LDSRPPKTLSTDSNAFLRDSITLSGTIRCRLRHNSVELERLLSTAIEFSYALLPRQTHPRAADLPSNLHWTKLEFQGIRPSIGDDSHKFRVPVSISGRKGSPDVHVLAVLMNQNSGRRIPISGFPVTMSQLTRRAHARF